MRISAVVRILGVVIEILAKQPELLKSWLADMVRSLIARAEKSENKIDDALLPLLHTLLAIIEE